MRRCLAVLVACAAFAASGADGLQADPWQRVRFLTGRWAGTVQGDSGDGSVTRSYEFTLGGAFIEERNVSTHPPATGSRAGEAHDHRGFISYDRQRQALVLRRFHPPGFVHTYVLDAVEGAGNVLVFDSRSLENLDAGYQARVSYEVYSNDEFVETFEVAAPGKSFDLRSRTRFTRVGRAAGE